jgi:predicted methyltransferase
MIQQGAVEGKLLVLGDDDSLSLATVCWARRSTRARLSPP